MIKNKSKIVLTVTQNIAKILDKFDIVLVGDPMANVLYGLKDTHKISMKNIIQHTKSKMGIIKSLLVVDMPKGTYPNIETAKKMQNKL